MGFGEGEFDCEDNMKFSQLRILTIDDSEMIQTILKNMLISFEVDRGQIFQASDGMEGLELAERHGLDIILCDLSMEPMDGFEFVRTLREHEREALRGLPVIILTVHGEEEFVSKAGKMAIEGYLLKPIAPKVLKQRVIQVLQNRALQVDA